MCLVPQLVVVVASDFLAQSVSVVRLQRFLVRTTTNSIPRFWIQTTMLWYANPSSKYSTLLLVPFSVKDFYWQLKDQRSLPVLPILSSHNRTFANQSHERNRYPSKVLTSSSDRLQ
ncbi:unnamed protein product [Schistosoma margrebowiei]|uniref:Uncharacterized protein n=1 Tax=Schistosoma margrebowiei TaxID=48269 RepID=A0A183MVM5_9TREM|nr:unnamed protein product [Schistosoma margrebowiei]